MNKDFAKVWTETAQSIAMGGKLSMSEIKAIADNIKVAEMDIDGLDSSLVVGSPMQRKDNYFKIAKKIWGYKPEFWLQKEQIWQNLAREASGSAVTGGKDDIEDVISAEILVRLVATAKIVTEYKKDLIVCKEALNAINAVLNDACSKGRTRMLFNGGQSVYTVLKNNGLMIGTGGGKFLPYPQKSLVELFLLLHKDQIYFEVYK